MRIAILGASGAMAQVVIRDLLEFVPEISITAADLNPHSQKDSRIRSVSLDVRNIEQTSRLISAHDVVLNCVNYYFNVSIMEACLIAGVPYSDLGGLYHGSIKQFALHQKFVDAGLTAVLGMGSTPGITNVMARALAQDMTEVYELHVRVGCFDATASGPLPVPYALDTVLDEFALEPMVFTGGQPRAVAPMSGEETIEFPAPAGRMRAIYTLHSEVAMFPRSFPTLKDASFKVAFPEDFTEKMRFLVELGFSSREEIFGDVSPRQMLVALASKQSIPAGVPNDCDVIRVHAKGIAEGKVVERMAQSVIFPHSRWKVGAGSLDTGVPLSIVGQMLATREINTPGVLCPETCVPVDRFFGELSRREIKIELS